MTAIIHDVLALARFTLLEAWRTRYAWMLVGMLLICVLFALMMRSQAITETHTIHISFLAASLRLLSIFVLCVYVINSFVREIQDKGMELMLTMPISRPRYVLGKFLGFALLALLTSTACGLTLLLHGVTQGVPLWTLSLFAESVILISLSIACVLSLSQLVTALSAVLAFYVLCRSITAIQLMSQGPLVDPTLWTSQVVEKLIDVVALFLPDLARFTQTAWLLPQRVDETFPDGLYLLGQTVIYVALLVSLSMIDLSRKNLDAA